jgi:Uma2 family endonuclease
MGNAPINHGLITNSIHRALYERLRGTGCSALGPEVGISTIGDTVRNPDALVTCTKLSGSDYLVPGAIIVFEVLSPNSAQLDKFIKVREYAAVPTILCYIIIESTSIGLTVLWCAEANQAFTTKVLKAEDTPDLPEIQVSMPVVECYDAVTFLDAP